MLKKLLFISLLLLLTNALFAQPPAKQIAKGVINGSAVNLPKPPYPAAAQALKASGEVKVQVTIDEAGNVVSAKAMSGHPLLRQSAEQAAWQAKFKPTLLSGVPVKVTGTIIYNFIPAPEPEINAQPDEIWAMGVIFALLERTDDATIKQLGGESEKEFAEMLREFADNIPQEMIEEKPLFEKMVKSTGAERQRLAGEIGKSLEKHFAPKELEVYQTGLILGAVIGESLKSFVPFTADKSVKLETARLKTDLALFRDKLNSSKPNLSSQTAASFSELAALADSDLNTLENQEKLFGLIGKIMDLVSFDEEETDDEPPAPSKDGD